MNRQGAMIHALGGHVLDLWRLARFEIHNPHSYSKTRQIRALARRTGARCFIETGTYLGNTTRRCAPLFDKVITVELDQKLHEQAAAYLRPIRHVECLQGDASKLLPGVIARPDVRDALVFLDGHFSKGETALGDVAEPACEEIETLGKHKDKIVGVIVDDFRCFGHDGWPKRSTLIASVEDHLGAEFDFAVHLDQLVAWKRSAVATRN